MLIGKGTPVDVIDRCCQAHDKCYSSVNSMKFCIAYIVSYNYAAQLGKATCRDSIGTCKYNACNCDKELTECFYKNLSAWNKNNIKIFDKLKC